MRIMAVGVLLCLLSALVEIHSLRVPYVSFMGTNLSSHSYVDLTLVGNASDGSDNVQCHTDLGSCCSNDQGTDRGDWFFPTGGRLQFEDHYRDIYEKREAQRVDLRRRNNSDISGIYRCVIETTAINNSTGRETTYVGLYASGGDVNVESEVILNVDSDLNGKFTLTCTSTGGPATTVTWTRDSVTVSGGITVLDDPVTAQYTHTLTVTGRLGGQYTCTVSNNKPSEDSAHLTIADLLIQLRLSAVHTCSYWVTDRTDLKLADITSAVLKKFNDSCDCQILSSEELFACFEDSATFVTYRARLSSTSNVNSVSLIEEWVSSGPTIRVRGVLMRVDTQCSVVISDFSEEECSSPSPEKHNVTTAITTADGKRDDQSDHTPAIVGGTAAIIIVLIVTVGVTCIAVVALIVRSSQVEPSSNNAEEYALTTIHKPTGVECDNITPNLVYQLVKQREGEEGHEYTVMSTSHQPPPPALADKKGNRIPSPHLPRNHVSAVPLPQSYCRGGAPEEAVYEHIGGDM